MESNGRFTYRPQAGDTGADTFHGRPDRRARGRPRGQRQRHGEPDAAGAHLVRRRRCPGPGTGTSSDPFKALPATAGDADDFIFVHNSTLTTTGGITLQNGQKLYGEAFGLSINQALNGNPAPVVLVAPGGSPNIAASTGNAVGVLANTASGNLANIEIRGLTLATHGRELERDRYHVGQCGERRRDDQRRRRDWRDRRRHRYQPGQHRRGDRVDDERHRDLHRHRHRSQRDGRHLDGDRLQRHHHHRRHGGAGITVSGATFDGTPAGAYQQVAGGTTVVGSQADPVGGAGIVMTNVSGDLAFTDLDIFTSNGPGLQVTGTGTLNGGAGTGMGVAVAAGGALQSVGGPVLNINNATATLPLDSATVTSSLLTGINLSGASGTIGRLTSGSLPARPDRVNDQGGTVSLNYGGNITQTNNVAMVSVSGGHATGTITFSGALNATNGTGLQFDNADSTYNFTGTTTLNGGDAGIDILNTRPARSASYGHDDYQPDRHGVPAVDQQCQCHLQRQHQRQHRVRGGHQRPRRGHGDVPDRIDYLDHREWPAGQQQHRRHDQLQQPDDLAHDRGEQGGDARRRQRGRHDQLHARGRR